MKALLYFSGFLFSTCLLSMEAEKPLNELVSSIVIHSPGGAGIRDIINSKILEEFVQKTEGAAYFDFESVGPGYARPRLSNKVLDPKIHHYAVAIGKIESNDWHVLHTMGNVTLLTIGFSKKPLKVSHVEVMQVERDVLQIFSDMVNNDFDVD